MPSKKLETVTEYIGSLTGKSKAAVKEIRSIIKKAAPKAEERISYNIPAFKLGEKNMIWYAGWKEHVSIYPIDKGMEKAVKGLADYKAAKGTIKFPLDKALPVRMITQIVKFKLKQ